MEMEERIARLKKLAMTNYEQGGHWFIECWDKKDWVEFVEACDRHNRPDDVCLREMWEHKESVAEDIRNS